MCACIVFIISILNFAWNNVSILPQATAVKAWGPIAKVVRRGGQPVVNFIASLYASEATAPVFFHFKAIEGLYNDELDELLKYMQVCVISLCSVVKCA